MKRSLLLVIALFPVLIFAHEPAKPVLKAGAATSNITPPLGMAIIGNFPPQPIASHIHDDLHVRCLALDDGETKLVFAVADNLQVPREIWDDIKQKLSADTGIPPSHMMFSATHTHSSVAVLSNQDPSMDYRRLFISRVVDGVKCALNNLEPARIAFGVGQLPQWVHNRRWILKYGHTNTNPYGEKDKAVMNPGGIASKLDRPAGPTNPDVYCLSVQAADGRQIALLANYWLHYVGGVPREHISADYFGEFCRIIERELGAPCVGILANGPCGDINSNDYSGKTPARSYEPYEKIKVVANDLANEVLKVHKTLSHQDWVPLKAAATELEVGGRLPTPEMLKWADETLARPQDAPPVNHRWERSYAERVKAIAKANVKSLTIPLQAFRLGDIAIAAIPFEVFTETGLELKERSPFPNTFTIELANGSFAYLPTPRHFELGGYETWIGTNRVERDASVKITDTVLKLFEQLKKD